MGIFNHILIGPLHGGSVVDHHPTSSGCLSWSVLILHFVWMFLLSLLWGLLLTQNDQQWNCPCTAREAPSPLTVTQWLDIRVFPEVQMIQGEQQHPKYNSQSRLGPRLFSSLLNPHCLAYYWCRRKYMRNLKKIMDRSPNKDGSTPCRGCRKCPGMWSEVLGAFQSNYEEHSMATV